MKTVGMLLLGLFTLTTTKQSPAQDQTTAPPAHVSTSFRFTIAAPLDRAAPLFGPEGERCWAGQQWNPHFLHPQPGKDTEGAVFTVQHGRHKSVWVNTLFDPTAGRMQYVSFIPDTLVFTVNVRLTALTQGSTSVEVTYIRTALSAEANDDVQAMAASGRDSGPHWQESIESCLNKRRKDPL